MLHFIIEAAKWACVAYTLCSIGSKLVDPEVKEAVSKKAEEAKDKVEEIAETVKTKVATEENKARAAKVVDTVKSAAGAAVNRAKRAWAARHDKFIDSVVDAVLKRAPTITIAGGSK